MFAQQFAAQRRHRIAVPERRVEFGVAVERAVADVRRADRRPDVIDQRDLGMHVRVLVLARGAAVGRVVAEENWIIGLFCPVLILGAAAFASTFRKR